MANIPNSQFIYALTKTVLNAIIEVSDQATENQLEKYCHLFDKCLVAHPSRQHEDVTYYFNKIIHALLSGIHRFKNFEFLVTLVYPNLDHFQEIPITDFNIIRGITHMFQGISHHWAELAFQQGLQMRAYPPQEVENQNYKEILIYSHYSPQEMQLIMQDAFQKILQVIGKVF